MWMVQVKEEFGPVATSNQAGFSGNSFGQDTCVKRKSAPCDISLTMWADSGLCVTPLEALQYLGCPLPCANGLLGVQTLLPLRLFVHGLPLSIWGCSILEEPSVRALVVLDHGRRVVALGPPSSLPLTGTLCWVDVAHSLGRNN